MLFCTKLFRWCGWSHSVTLGGLLTPVHWSRLLPNPAFLHSPPPPPLHPPPPGIMLFRTKSLPFVDEWIKVIEADDTVWDQNAFNELVRKGQQLLPDNPHHLWKGELGGMG